MAQNTDLDLTQLSIPQLQQLKKQLDSEIQQFAQNHSKFNVAMQRVLESKNSLTALTPESKDQEILVPLTQSLYVPGKLTNVDTVLVDVGTGYFFEKKTANAVEHFSKKAKIVQEQAEALEKIIHQRRTQSKAVLQMLQARIRQQTAAAPAQWILLKTIGRRTTWNIYRFEIVFYKRNLATSFIIFC